MKKAALATATVLFLLTVAGCGGSGDKAKSDGVSAAETRAITSAIAKGITATGGILDTKGADCVATAFVKKVGAKQLLAAKVVTKDDKYNENGANVDLKTSNAYVAALLSCVDRSTATAKIKQNLVNGSTGTSIPKQNAACYIDKLVSTVDVEHLFSSKIVVDTGLLSQNAATPDADTAAKSTDALLGCVNYYEVIAKEQAGQDKKLDAAKYASCLKVRFPTPLLRRFLTAVQSQSPDLQAVSAEVSTKTAACAKIAKKK